ncbi:MAG: hypothetical protein ACD_5C00202G0004 [uncultured bacterium]|nr:MAG: hypothetical protein ACD_5C00202G0004 [uncultured bacterium]
MEKPKEKSLLKQILEFVSVYILSMFIILFAFGHSPDNQIRFYFSSLMVAMAIFTAYEVGRSKVV